MWLDTGVLALVVADKGEGVVAVAAGSTAAAEQGAATLERRLREEPDEPSDIEVSFWTGGMDPWRSRRRIEAPLLEEVAANYPDSVRTQVERLANMRDPQRGSLILWHGPPGTGKSWALRALAREWREWCSTHYVTDPESFLGSGTQYLMHIVRERSDEARPWQLIALEDAGELMAADARSETGQALSRLLNLTDGLLGQGMRTLVVVTTNEKIGRLHPAVRRPGRCLAAIGFERFSAQLLALRDAQQHSYVLQVLWPAAGPLHANEVVEADDGHLELAQGEHQRAPSHLLVGGSPLGFVEHVKLAVPREQRRDDRRDRQLLCVGHRDRAGVLAPHASLQLAEGTRQVVEVGPLRSGNDVEVLGGPPVAVDLSGHAADHQVLDAVANEGFEQGAQVEGARRRRRSHGGVSRVAGCPARLARSPAISSSVATRFHEHASRRRSAGVRSRADASSPALRPANRGVASMLASFPSTHSSSRSRSQEGSSTPRSMRLIASWLVPARTASRRWVRPRRSRALRTTSAA